MQSPAITLLVLAAAVQPLSAQLSTNYIVDVIHRLNDVYRFRTLPIFTKPVDRFRDLPEKLAQQFDVPQIVICEDSSQKVKDIVDTNVLSIVLTENLTGTILNTAVDQLRGIHRCKAIFVITTPVALQRQPYFLNFLWEAQFVNVLVFFDDLDSNTAQIFAMDPFPELKWMNQTSLTDVSKLFLNYTDNWMGHRVELPFTEDAPRVFPFKKNGVTSMAGRHAIIIALFAKHMNITLIPKYTIDLDLAKLLLEFHIQKMDFSVHSFSKRDLEGVGATYPMESVRWCVMVPLRSEVPKSKYVVIAFDGATWLVACISIVYVALLLRYIDPPPKTSQKRYFLRSFTLLMYSPNMAERMYSPSIRQFAFFTLVFLLGFILSCIYSTYLTSYCTNMVFQPPIDSVKDLQKEKLRVMVIDYELESIRESQMLGKDFLELLYPVSYFEMLKYRNNFNGCYAYTIRQDRWRFLDKQQRGLKKKLFRLSEICFGRQYVVFPLPHDSCLEESLNQFILYIKQAGLDLFWEEEAFRMAVTMKYSKILVEQTVIIQQLQLDYFEYVFAAFSVGVVLSLICFIVELTNKKILDLKRDLQRIRTDRY